MRFAGHSDELKRDKESEIPEIEEEEEEEKEEEGESEGEEEEEAREMRQMVLQQNRKKKKSGGFQSMGESFSLLPPFLPDAKTLEMSPGLSGRVFKGIMKKGYRVPTPIQRKVRYYFPLSLLVHSR